MKEPTRKTAALLEDVRSAYVQGQPLKRISERFGISTSTINVWRRADLAAGIDWQAGRELGKLVVDGATLAGLVELRDALMQRARGEDAPEWPLIAELCRAISTLRKAADPARHARELRRFWRWCQKTLDEDQLDKARRALHGYISDRLGQAATEQLREKVFGPGRQEKAPCGSPS